MAGRHARFSLSAAGLALVLVASCSGAAAPPPTPPPIAVTVDGVTHQVPPGTTLGSLLAQLQLRPEAGRLLSVNGDVLSRHAFPGSVELDGGRQPRSTKLSAGDAIVVVNGEDQTEGTKRESHMLRGFHPGDPQRTLRTYPLKEIDVVGRTSGQVKSVEYRPVGKPKVPGEVALTFDDGPWPKQTQKVLSILKHHRVHATFFMIGKNVAQWPSIANDVRKAGMTIGNHTWDHPQDPGLDQLTDHRIQTEISDAEQQLHKAGIKPFLFRPPGGSYDDRVVQEARAEGLRVVLWSVDPQDWRASRTAKQIAHLVLSHVQPGSIVLMHDGGGDQSATIKALPTIIKGIRKMGLKLVAIPR